MATVIGYGNLIDSATLSGTWVDAANIKNRYLAQKATAGTGAYLDIDLGSAQSVGLVALIADTITSGTVTITAGTAVGGATLYSSGAVNIYTGSDFALTFASISARYWRISISAGGTIGRVFIGPRFRPTNNIDWSPTLSIESKTAITEALSGPEYFDIRPSRRVWQGKWSWLSEAESQTWLTVERTLDTAGEVYLIYDDLDTTYRGTRNFLGRLRTLGPIEYPYVNQYSTAIEVSELL